jgi:hypothetical protein
MDEVNPLPLAVDAGQQFEMPEAHGKGSRNSAG